MNQQNIGNFLKKLRKEKGLTQEQFAEIINVSNRTVSRWETGRNMPDLDILIEIAEFYDVEIRELIDGERKSERMDKELKETVLKVADYTNEERKRLMKKLHFFSWIGVLTFIVFLVLEALGLADSGVTEDIASFCCGISFGILLVTVVYTSNYIYRFHMFKKKLLHRQN